MCLISLAEVSGGCWHWSCRFREIRVGVTPSKAKASAAR